VSAKYIIIILVCQCHEVLVVNSQ